MGVIEEGGKAVAAVAESLKASPLTLALLLVNLTFLAAAVWVLSEVAENARERNTNQLELIKGLLSDVRNCTRGTPP